MTLVLVLDALRAGSLAMLGTIGRASLEATVVAGVVWGLCRSLPTIPPAVRAWLWWLVSLKLMLSLLGMPALPLAWLPTATWSPTTSASPIVLPAPDDLVRDASLRSPAAMPDRVPVAIPYASLWPMALLVVWLVVAVRQAAGLLRAFQAARHLRRQAVPAPPGIVSRAARVARLFALPVLPRVLASRLTAVPLLTGVIRPAILLPATSASALSRAEVDLVLGHEFAHVRRGDLVWGWVPALASRLFFFHPLARLAGREYLAAREEACDAEVLQTLDVAPADYGRLLVKLGVATTDDVLAAAGSSPTFDLLKRRLIMLDRSSTPASRWWWAMTGATAVLVPLTLVAQPAPPAPPPPPAPVATHAEPIGVVPPLP
uniref:M56 family metallopeptidase n=1 Tax=Luteitalea sp. TaxID=2004800 RepID=UPI0025B83CB8